MTSPDPAPSPASAPTPGLRIGLLVFSNVTQLDLTGPLQVFADVPGASVDVIGKTPDPVPTDAVITLTPTVTYAACPQLDVLCVPGGHGVDLLLDDDETLDFLRSQAERARYVTSVCTGALLLGAAGLLQGYRATTHWSAFELLAEFGATPERSRVCHDRDRITGGGVTAGIDFALSVVAELCGRDVAERIQLHLEYDPAPPFTAGSPSTAPTAVLEAFRAAGAAHQADREERVRRAAARMRA
ncbi:DJ-1/PfpI family protein [Herbiconiux sp. A18JL235]|uniref:DJ-1/PfpI family protein n=1 Tax=Herbiconiux sp. A18JL235 TaxID=3152363 RepID=A0AB39BF24_9MICO